MKNIIFIAPPAAGKGTQSSLLMDQNGYEHISTGDLLREITASGTELGIKIKTIMQSGKLIDDELMIEIINNKLLTIKDKPFILDGFPRTLNQAMFLTKLFEENNIINYVCIYLNLDKENAMKRSLGRITCLNCGQSYNLYEENLKPKQDMICDKCNYSLEKRSDDNEEAFNIRFDTFLNSTAPIKDYYESLNRLVTINANDNTENIYKNILENVK